MSKSHFVTRSKRKKDQTNKGIAPLENDLPFNLNRGGEEPHADQQN